MFIIGDIVCGAKEAMEMGTKDVFIYLMFSGSLAALGVVLLVSTAILTHYLLEGPSRTSSSLAKIASICRKNIRGFLVEWLLWATCLIPIMLFLIKRFELSKLTFLPVVLYLSGFYGGRLFEVLKNFLYQRKISKANNLSKVNIKR